jgi:hypothetical protein
VTNKDDTIVGIMVYAYYDTLGDETAATVYGGVDKITLAVSPFDIDATVNKQN